jgi:hypothetical protein
MLQAPQPPGASNINSVTGAQPPKRRAGVDKATFGLTDSIPEFPATPPPDALLALDRAAKVASDLRARRLDVQFAPNDDGRVHVKVVDAGGKTLARIPVAHALDLLSGDGPVTILDALA